MKSTGTILIIYNSLIISSEYEECSYHTDNLKFSDTQE